MEAIISTLMRKKIIFILCDINDDLLCGRNKLNSIKSKRLIQTINKPTGITPTSTSLLDTFITNKFEKTSHEVVSHIIADYDLITATVKISKPKRIPGTKTLRLLANYNREAFCLSQHNDTIEQILFTDNVKKQVDILINIFTDCLVTCALLVTKKAPLFSNEIRQAVTNRDSI